MKTCHLIPFGTLGARASRFPRAISALAGLLLGLAPFAAEADPFLIDWFPIAGDYSDRVSVDTNLYLSGFSRQLCADRHGNQSGAMHITYDHLHVDDTNDKMLYYANWSVANTISLWVKPEGELTDKSDVNTVVCPILNRPDVASIGLAVSKTKIWLQKSNKSADGGVEDLIEYEHDTGEDWVHVAFSFEQKAIPTNSPSGGVLILNPTLAEMAYRYEYKLYVNGSLVTSKEDYNLYPTMFVLPSSHFSTGRCNFTGAIDDLQVYYGTLSEKEVSNIYQTGLPWRIAVELTNNGTELQDKTTYQVTNNLELTGVSGSALKVATNATVIIEIPTNVTLTAIGSKGMAGILVPSNSTLIVTGGGKLIAQGGAAGEGFAGIVGGNGTTEWVKDGATWEDKWCDCRSGAGGDGGQGGVGAGAGIGGDGGAGGVGGTGADRVVMKDRMGDVNANGLNGSAGSAAGNGGTMGRFVAVGSVNVYATGGAASTTARESASGGSSQTYDRRPSAVAFYTAAGGGGGGSGGVGFAGAGIGGGGAGGGGGGGGGSGAIHYDSSEDDASGLKKMAQGGFGGEGSVSGNQGKSLTHEYIKSGEGYRNGAGGAAGAAGAAGGAGIFCRQLTATVSGRLETDGDESNLFGHFAANAVTLTLKGGYDGAEDVVTNAWLGVGYPVVTALRHSRDGFLLRGYCDETGAMYYDELGRPVEGREYCTDFEGLTLTAVWKPIEHVGVFVRSDSPVLNQWEECSVPGLLDAVRGWTYDEDENVLTILDGSKNYWISGSNRIGQVEIRIATNTTVTLTNFVSESFSASALTVENGCEAVLRLAGLNILSSTNVSGAAGINCATGSCLTIDAAEGVRTDRAFLVAAAGEGGAGIGGNEEEGSGTITINGATIAARGGIKGGAGIGGGGHAGTCGDVTISGGRVNAAAGGTFQEGLPIIDLDINWDALWDEETEFDVDCEINWPGKWEESDDTSTETWTRGADIGGGGSYRKDKNMPDNLKDLIGLIPKVGETIVKVMEIVDKVTDFLNWAKTEHFGTFGRICINGGTVRAPIVGGHPTDDSCVVLDGGSVLTVASPLDPVNSSGTAILPIAFTNAVSSPAALTIPDYGTKDLYPDLANALYLWLPADDYRITMDERGYMLTVNDKFDYTLTPSVQVGKNAWALAYGGTCEIYGEGAMWNTWTDNVSPIMAMGDSVTHVVFTEDVTSVGNGAFRGMNGLRDVQIGGKVDSIGIGAFYACTNLTNVVCGATVGEVAALAFQSCPSLETIRFDAKVDLAHIAESAFTITAYISMDGDQPVIDSRPKIVMPGLVETLRGSNVLTDPAGWPNVEDGNASAYHFFKVFYEEK